MQEGKEARSSQVCGWICSYSRNQEDTEGDESNAAGSINDLAIGQLESLDFPDTP